jgi:hypothetical protein
MEGNRPMADRTDSGRVTRRRTPGPFDPPTRPVSDYDLFPDDEAPTRPGGPSHQFNRLANAYRELTAEDRLWLDRLVELMAYAGKE